eukprot:5364897-Amphidinium_carterae.2
MMTVIDVKGAPWLGRELLAEHAALNLVVIWNGVNQVEDAVHAKALTGCELRLLREALCPQGPGASRLTAQGSCLCQL